MSKSITVSAGILDNVIRFIELSSMTTKRAMDEVSVHRTGQEKAAALRAPLLDRMIKHKVVAEKQKTAADAMLGSHDTTLSLLSAAVEKIAELNAVIAARPSSLGEGAPDTTGSSPSSGSGEYNSLHSLTVGEKTANVKESDRAFLRLIGK